MEFKWSVCLMCGPHVVCPLCGMNTCSGGYGDVDGEKCVACPQAYAIHEKAQATGTVPVLPGSSLEERRIKLAENRKRLEAMGVKFATAEDLENL